LTSFAQALEQLLSALDRLGIPFFIGGSVASASHGIPRQTKDVDIVADFRNTDTSALCELLRAEFYLDEQHAREAIALGRSFNAIHLKSAYKFDLFPARADAFTQSQMGRRRYILSSVPGLENVEIPVSSPEDSILSKLIWFRKGGEVSEQQWHDILGILSVQSANLDHRYLTEWADRLNVADLLAKAQDEVRSIGGL
jgi:hypothetical protein